MLSPTNSGQASKTPCAMTIAQIDEALRDFVLQDTAQLRRDAETASQREPEAPQMVSEFVRQMAGTSLTKLGETITDLTQLRDFLHAEGERIKREISGYLQFNEVAMDSTKLVVDNIARCRGSSHSLDRRDDRYSGAGAHRAGVADEAGQGRAVRIRVSPPRHADPDRRFRCHDRQSRR